LFSTIILCRAALERFSVLCLLLSTSRKNFPFIFNCTEKAIVNSETRLDFEKVNKFLIHQEFSTIRV